MVATVLEGMRAPDPVLLVDGAPVRLHAFRGERSLLLVFLRHLA